MTEFRRMAKVKAFELELKEIENVQALVIAEEGGITFMVQTIMGGALLRGDYAETPEKAIDNFEETAISCLLRNPTANKSTGIDIQLQ